jgi:hypothetical protein
MNGKNVEISDRGQYKVPSRYYSDDDDNNNVYGRRLRLWTVTSNGPIIHTHVIYELEDPCWHRHGKTPDSSTTALWQSYQQSNLVAKQEEPGKEINFS